MKAKLIQPNPKHVLGKAVLNAGQEMGLTQTEISAIVGRDRTSIATRGIDPQSKSGELALLVVRIYRSLFALLGGESKNIKHWIHTENHHIGGIPSSEITKTTGLVRVVEYLDAIRGKA